MTTALLLAAGLLVLVGLAGLILPALPAGPLIFIGLLLAAWAEDFAFVGWRTLSILGFLTALGIAADFVAGAFGARRFGATRRAAVGSAIGAVIGLFFGIIGILIGPFLGAVAGELTARSDLRLAGRAGFGAMVGLLLGVAAKTAISFTMIGLYLVVRFFGGT